jgi:hypothetical protein
MTTQKEIRAAFWNTFCVDGVPKEYRGKRQNALPCDVRCAFVDYVDNLQKNGVITENLANRVTL